MHRTRFTALLDAPLWAVESALLEPAALDRLVAAAPLLQSFVLDERSERDDVVYRRARMRAALIPPFMMAALETGQLEWIERVSWSRTTHHGEFSIEPTIHERYRDRFRCRGDYRLEARGHRSERIIDLELEILAPLLGPVLERLVASQLRPQFALEARLLEARGRELARAER